ncbi:hypothetical protein DITRI_Ditri11bG0111700 [Diplodiscus trichospermus]
MALYRRSLVFSLLLLSLLVIASAGDHYGDGSSKYGFDGIPAGSPQPKPDGDASSSKYGFDGIPADGPQAKPGGDASSKYGFDGIPADSPQAKPEGEEKPHYGATKPDYYKPKPVDKEKADSGKKPEVVKSKPEEEKPYYSTKPGYKENRLSIGVQGLVLCKSGSKNYPIQGALAKIICKAVDEVGVEKTLSICSGATDAKGYFFATVLSHSDKLKIRECKAYLQSSPLKNCNMPTNVNKAIDGALLSGFRVLKDKKMKLYSVKPFFYTSKAYSTSNGY